VAGTESRGRSKTMPQRSSGSNLDHPEAAQAPSPSQAPSPPAAERITVALIPKASADFQRTLSRSHLSKTDIINRALSLYEFVDAERSAGSEFIVRRPSGEERYVVFL
jgi:hypothetical protein